jgi:hypothetical protein
MPPVEYIRIVSLWGLSAQSGQGWGLVDTWQEDIVADSIMFFTPIANGGVANIPFYTAKLSCPVSLSGSKKIYVKHGQGYDWPNIISGELIISKKINGKDYSKKITFRDFQNAYTALELTNPGEGYKAAVEVHDFANDSRDVWIRIDFVKPFVIRDSAPDIDTVSNITDSTADVDWLGRFGCLDSGICVSTSSPASLQDTVIRYGEDFNFGNDPFTTNLTGLTPLTTYYVRTFMITKQPINYYLSQKLGIPDQRINNEGVGPFYGTETTFTTTA